jgi:tetratricopeptide (TPR) repeat protein
MFWTRIAPMAALLLAGGLRAAVAAPAPAEPGTAQWLIDHRHWKQARARLEADLARHPDDAGTLCLLSQVRQEFDDLDGAQALIDKALKLAPQNGAVHAQAADLFGERAGKAGMLKAMGLAKKFRQEAEVALSLDPSLIRPRRGLVEFHMRAPGIAGGDKKKAREYAAQIAALDPAQGELMFAVIDQIQKDSTKVEGHYRRAIELDPNNVEARLSLAGWLTTPWRSRWAEAETQVLAARKAVPDRGGPLASLAALYAQQSKWAELDAVLAEATTVCPDDRGAWYQAGRILLLNGTELPRAERYFRHYLGLEPEANGPKWAHAHWRLGLVLEKLGHRPEAIGELETALKLVPDLDEAKKDLKRMRAGA